MLKTHFTDKTSNLYFAFKGLAEILEPYHVDIEYINGEAVFSYKQKQIVYKVSFQTPAFESDYPCFSVTIFCSLYFRKRIAGMVLSKLQRNKKIFARKCVVAQVDGQEEIDFVTNNHIMGATSSAYNLGLYYESELVAIATFSKGRKMHRLPPDKRSFELIRFCCKFGITVTGGLSKLMKHFCEWKQAGDIMTYVSKQYGDEKSFLRAGFVLAEQEDYHFNDITNSSLNKNYRRNEFYNSEKNNLLFPNRNFKMLYIPKSKQ